MSRDATPRVIDLMAALKQALKSQPELGRQGVQASVIKTYEACGCTVALTAQSYRRGSRRNPGTSGIPDLYVWPPVGNPLARNSAPWWHESKAPAGRQKFQQAAWQSRCEMRGVAYVLGGVTEALAHLRSLGLVA